MSERQQYDVYFISVDILQLEENEKCMKEFSIQHKIQLKNVEKKNIQKQSKILCCMETKKTANNFIGTNAKTETKKKPMTDKEGVFFIYMFLFSHKIDFTFVAPIHMAK